MREILFKAKRIDNGKWVEGYLYVRHDGAHEIGAYNKEFNIERWTSEVDPDTVCQYTGIKDKNGKRIFENDIIMIEFEDGNSPEHGKWWEHAIVVFSAKYHGWYAEFGDDFISMYEYDDGLCAEIVGNAHDNPELLNS